MNLHALFLFFAFFTPVIAMSKTQNSHQEVMKTIKKHSKLIKKNAGITLRIYGLSYAGPDKIYDGKIHEIDLGYSIDKNANYNEAKKLFYNLANGLLNELNSNESIKTYFYHYPVGYQDLRLTLSFDYENKGFLKKDDVKMIGIQQNEITYYIVTVDGMTNGLVATETYPGMGTLTFTGWDSMRTITKKLPEPAEEELNQKEGGSAN